MTINTRFDGKVGVVTGAASGMGAAISGHLRQLGATVVGIDYTAGEGIEQCDVSSEGAVEDTFGRIEQRYPGMHFAVNAAGINHASMLTHERSMAEWQQMMDVNLTGVFLCMRAELKAMLRAGGGSMVNISSTAGVGGTPTLSHYSAAKSGVIGLTKSAALEYATQGIRVNAICPGPTRTPMLRAWTGSEDDLEKHGLTTPMQRLGEVEEIAATAAYLLSDAAGYVTGVAFAHDGGRSARS